MSKLSGIRVEGALRCLDGEVVVTNLFLVEDGIRGEGALHCLDGEVGVANLFQSGPPVIDSHELGTPIDTRRE